MLVSQVVDLAARRSVQAARAGAEAETLSTFAGSLLRGEQALPALIERVRESFAMTSASLLRRDEATRTNDQASAGVTCAVVSGAVVYLAQVGQTLLYLRRAGGRLERLRPDASNTEPLGEATWSPQCGASTSGRAM